MNMATNYDEDLEAAQRIARHVRAYMERFELNQSEMADQLGITPSAVNRILSGKRGLGLGLAVRIARRLNIDPHALLLREPH